jgi:hypothetical protein
MTAPVVFEIQSLADLEHITDSVGQAGPRTGRAKRTKEQMEWFVLSRFLEKAIPDGIFKLPSRAPQWQPRPGRTRLRSHARWYERRDSASGDHRGH